MCRERVRGEREEVVSTMYQMEKISFTEIDALHK